MERGRGPFHRVGVITAHHQDSWDEDRVDAVNEKMRFGIWTGLVAHRPLSNINGARNALYRHSADYRRRFIGCPILEPAAGR